MGQDAIKVPFRAKAALRDLAKKYKVTSDHMLKARRFVELLSQKKCLALLAQKCELTTKPLSWSHVRHLVSVNDEGIPIEAFCS